MDRNEFQQQNDLLSKQIEQIQQAISSTQAVENKDTTWWTTTNAMTISTVVLIFGLIVCFLAAMLLRQGKSAESILKTLGTILIIVAALFLVVAGYGTDQIAPVIGLLGTIAGYLLGKSHTENKS